jgi:GT2 family glycosyltransferase
MSGVGIVVVTHNSAAEIASCIEAAKRASAEIVVVDNASADSTVEQARRLGVAVIANPENRGFAAAVNQGIRAIRSDQILLLNPDAILTSPIAHLAAVCARPEAGAAGGKLTAPDGSPQRGFNVRRLPTPAALAFEVLLINRLWPRNPVNWHYRCYDLSLDEAARVEQPAGALLMFRREVWELVGGFDESFYPLWFEDVDFCKRLEAKGYYLYYDPQVTAVHQGGHSIRKITFEKREVYWYGNLLRYGFKHFTTWAARCLCLAVIAGSMLRAAAGIVAGRSFTPLRVYGRVIGLAGKYLLFGPSPSVKSASS